MSKLAFQHGKSAGFAIQDASTTYRNITQYVNSVEFSREAETAEVTTFNSTNFTKAYIAGLKDATASIEGKWDPTIDGYLDGILGEKKQLRYFPATTDKTDTQFIQYKMDGICTSYSPPASVDDAVTYSAEFQVTGSVTRSTSTG